MILMRSLPSSRKADDVSSAHPNLPEDEVEDEQDDIWRYRLLESPHFDIELDFPDMERELRHDLQQEGEDKEEYRAAEQDSRTEIAREDRDEESGYRYDEQWQYDRLLQSEHPVVIHQQGDYRKWWGQALQGAKEHLRKDKKKSEQRYFCPFSAIGAPQHDGAGCPSSIVLADWHFAHT